MTVTATPRPVRTGGPAARTGLPARRHRRPARDLHPVAWWLWAAGMAAAVSRTTDPLLLALLLVCVGLVVVARRPAGPAARPAGPYLVLAIVVVAVRVGFRVVFGGGSGAGDHVLVDLPHLPLPSWMAGVQIGGPVTAEAVLSAGVDGFRLACLLCCVGAANTLADPRRALRLLPGALYEVGVAVVVAVSVAPQLVDSVTRVRAARRLRAGPASGRRALRGILIPVLEDALERSLHLAAAMDARGYGRLGPGRAGRPATRRSTTVLLLGGLGGLCVGAYGLFDPSAPRLLAGPALAAGGLACAGGLVLGGRRVRRTRYRPDRWGVPEWAVVVCGAVPAAVMAFGPVGAGVLDPSFPPLVWPALPAVAAAAVLVGAAAAVAAPPPVPAVPPQAVGGSSVPPAAGRPTPAPVAVPVPGPTATVPG